MVCLECLTPENRGIKKSSLFTNNISKDGKGVGVSDSKKCALNYFPINLRVCMVCLMCLKPRNSGIKKSHRCVWCVWRV